MMRVFGVSGLLAMILMRDPDELLTFPHVTFGEELRSPSGSLVDVDAINEEKVRGYCEGNLLYQLPGVSS